MSRVDLRIGDITKKDPGLTMPDNMTAANFGKIADGATDADLAKGIINMVFETIGMLAVFAARANGVKDIVLTGNLSSVRYAKEAFGALSDMFGVHFIIPENAQFGTVIGSALSGF